VFTNAGWRPDGHGQGLPPLVLGACTSLPAAHTSILQGGSSIWGQKFADELRESLKHSARGVVSMANSGPNTNASQFFITYAKHPHLNGELRNFQVAGCSLQHLRRDARAGKYTIFGRVIHGMEVLDAMEKARACGIVTTPILCLHVLKARHES